MRIRLFALLAALAAVAWVLLALLDRSGDDERDARGVEAEQSSDASSLSPRPRGMMAMGPRAAPSDSAQRTGSVTKGIRGRVVDLDGEPVTGGVVNAYCLDGDDPGTRVPGVPLALREDGTFVGTGCAGRMCLLLEHPTFLQADPWLLEAGEDVTLTARPLARLTGIVRDADGAPLRGAKVRLLPFAADEDPTALPAYVGARQGTRTDVEGRFEFVRVERPPCDACGELSGRCDPATHETLPGMESMRLVVQARRHQPMTRKIDVDTTHEVEIDLVRASGRTTRF